MRGGPVLLRFAGAAIIAAAVIVALVNPSAAQGSVPVQVAVGGKSTLQNGHGLTTGITIAYVQKAIDPVHVVDAALTSE